MEVELGSMYWNMFMVQDIIDFIYFQIPADIIENKSAT